MPIVDFVCLLDIRLVPIRIARFVAAENKVRGATRVERKKNPIWPALMLHPQFLHVCMPGIADRVHMRTAKRRPEFFEQVHRKVDAFVLIVREFSIPFGKLVADFDRPRHAPTIPLMVYTVKGIFCASTNSRSLALFITITRCATSQPAHPLDATITSDRQGRASSTL